MWIERSLAAAAVALCLHPAAAQDTPASAIDWLNQMLAAPNPVVEPAISDTADPPSVAVTSLGGQDRDSVGLLAPQITGLPATTFSTSAPERLLTLIADIRPNDVPALQELALLLLLAELAPPTNGLPRDSFLLARVDRLVVLGALDQAQALLEQAGPTTPELFSRWFDVSLLTGNDDAACSALRAQPQLSGDLAARAFCLSRGDDWAAAALTLETGAAVGAISEADALLLAHFLDPEQFEGAPLPPMPETMTPLRYRLLDGIGEPPITLGLPLAYAMSDLRETIGWKAQLEAAERLARARAIGPAQLHALYTERRPAASGGVWDRAAAFQEFDTAFMSGDPGAIANALPAAWAAMSAAGLQLPFAALYGDQLPRLPLAPAPAALAFKVGLLSDAYEEVARTAETPDLPRDAFAQSIAIGKPIAPIGLGPTAQAIANGFALEEAPAQFQSQMATGRLGEALLHAIALLQDGAQSDPGDIVAAIGLLRAAGLIDVARRTALQLLLLERPR